VNDPTLASRCPGPADGRVAAGCARSRSPDRHRRQRRRAVSRNRGRRRPDGGRRARPPEPRPPRRGRARKPGLVQSCARARYVRYPDRHRRGHSVRAGQQGWPGAKPGRWADGPVASTHASWSRGHRHLADVLPLYLPAPVRGFGVAGVSLGGHTTLLVLSHGAVARARPVTHEDGTPQPYTPSALAAGDPQIRASRWA